MTVYVVVEVEDGKCAGVHGFLDEEDAKKELENLEMLHSWADDWNYSVSLHSVL